MDGHSLNNTRETTGAEIKWEVEAAGERGFNFSLVQGRRRKKRKSYFLMRAREYEGSVTTSPQLGGVGVARQNHCEGQFYFLCWTGVNLILGN